MSDAVITVVRVWLPDRPGALGQVASRIGSVRGDVLGIEILEQGGGRAVDELIVALPSSDLLGLLTREVGAVDGVSVEEVRIVPADRADASMSTLALGAAVAEAPAGDRLRTLVDGAAAVLEADWVCAISSLGVVGWGDGPDLAWLEAFLAGSTHLVEGSSIDTDTTPSDLVWAPLGNSDSTIIAGRSQRPFHERERRRFSLLAQLADALIER